MLLAGPARGLCAGKVRDGYSRDLGHRGLGTKQAIAVSPDSLVNGTAISLSKLQGDPSDRFVHDLASRFVVFRRTTAAKVLELSDPPVYAAVRRLEEAGILREVTGRQRGKLYVYDEYLARLNEGTTDPAAKLSVRLEVAWRTYLKDEPAT